MAYAYIHTIGYGNRSFQEFVDILVKNEISFLVDVRTVPTSRRDENFSRENIGSALELNKIKYVFMGASLGGRPSDINCYTHGHVDYKKIMDKPFFNVGIERIKTASDKKIRLALMCSECKPEECHRSKLIGEKLTELNIPLVHIDENGKSISHAEVMVRLQSFQTSLIENNSIYLSRKKYF